MTPNAAPFTGQLIEIPDRAERIAFYRTVVQLAHAGELPPETRIVPVGGSFLLTTLDTEQIEDVAASAYDVKLTFGEPEPEPEPLKKRPRSRPVPSETKALIFERLAAGVPISKVAREVQRSYSTIYYLHMTQRRAARRNR